MADPSSQASQSITLVCPIPIDELHTLSEGCSPSQILVSDTINKPEMKERIDRAMEWLEEEPSEKASTAAIIFQVNPASIRMRQYRQRHQERNSRGTYNHHGGNNIILTKAQELAVFRFCLEQLEAGLGATPSIIYAAICYLRQQEKRNPPSLVWFRQSMEFSLRKCSWSAS